MCSTVCKCISTEYTHKTYVKKACEKGDFVVPEYFCWLLFFGTVMSTERLISGGDHSALSSSHSLRYGGEATAATRIFEELPTATIVSVSRPDASDLTPLLWSYTIELQYRQVSSISRRFRVSRDYHAL